MNLKLYSKTLECLIIVISFKQDSLQETKG